MSRDGTRLRWVDLPYGRLPKKWKNSCAVGCIEGTRWFVERGHAKWFDGWFNEVNEANPGDLIPMQWAPTYIGTSRQAVRKRALAGLLTVFTYSVKGYRKTVLGKRKYEESRKSFDFLILSECRAWREALFDQRTEALAEQEAAEEERERLLPRSHRRKRS